MYYLCWSGTTPSNLLANSTFQAEKKAAAKARELAERQKKEAADAEDVSKEDYAELPLTGSKDFKPTNTPRVDLSTIAEHENKEITFRCWVANARSQSAKLTFLNLRQGSNTVQAVVAASDKLSKQMVKFCGTVSTESLLAVTGLVKKAPEPIKSATIQDYEIHIKKLFVEHKAEIPLPLQVEDAERPLPAEGEEEKVAEGDARPLASLSTRLNNRTIDLRAQINQAIFVIKFGVTSLFTEFLAKKGFIGFQTPKIIGAASEGGANVFELNYFGKPAYLAQSPQFYKQMLITSRFPKVMEIGPVFRAENSNTARHLTEFTGLDLEMEFQEHYHEVMAVLEDLMLFIFTELNARYKKETDLVRSVYNVEPFKLPESGKVPRIPFPEGIKMLREDGEFPEIGDYDDLSTPQEKRLGALVLKKYNSDFFVLDQFPLAVRPAYTMPSPENAKLSNSYDMFMRGQEICSGAQRIHDAELLAKMMREHDPPIDPNGPGTKEYVDSFRYGAPPHGGGGFGLERIVQFWLGLPNIRMTSLFPRDPQRVAP